MSKIPNCVVTDHFMSQKVIGSFAKGMGTTPINIKKFRDFSKNFDIDESAILLHYPQQFIITSIRKTFSIGVRGYKIKIAVWSHSDVSNPSHST